MLALPAQLHAFWRRLTNRWRDDGQSAASAEEIAFHVDMLTRDNLAAGMTPRDARNAAIRRFGNRARTGEDSRDAWGVRALEIVVQDVRYAARTLSHDPRFTLTLILTLAVGIGATVATFAAVNGVLLRSLPVRDQSSPRRAARSARWPGCRPWSVRCRPSRPMMVTAPSRLPSWRLRGTSSRSWACARRVAEC